VACIGAALGLSTYIVTENLPISITSAFIALLLFGSLTLRINSSHLLFKRLWRRNIYYEAFAMTAAVSILFFNIQKLPFQTSDKALIMMAVSFGLALLHTLFSLFHDISENLQHSVDGAREVDLQP
jgi:hypothetical protein